MKMRVKTGLAFLVLGIVTCAAQEPPSATDLLRARTRKPRTQYQGHGTLASANAQLNVHLLKRSGLRTEACEAHSILQVREVLKALFQMRNPELVATYAKDDGRAPAYASLAEMEAHWATLPEHSVEDGMKVRDAHCHEAVMWFVHHLTTPKQEEFAKTASMPALPLLPTKEHPKDNLADPVTKLYASKVTCQKCHVGGIPEQYTGDVRPATQMELQRRCYTNYKDLYNITCGPCDGVGGISRGDTADDFDAPPCTIIGYPKDVPEAERVKPKIPPQYAVTLHGSDRFGRATNPFGHKDNIFGELYGTMTGRWYVDTVPGADQWFLRHDVNFSQLYLKGKKIPLIHDLRETEIHVQSELERKNNITGAMVTMLYGVPDSVPGGCTCIPDPVGVPDMEAAEAPGNKAVEDGGSFEFLGRIKMTTEFLEETLELDHWASWFFHIFMAVDKTRPEYGKAPARIGSAYAGMAVYQNWSFGDPKVVEAEDVWKRGIPLHPERVGPDHGKYCMNPKKYPLCNNISQATYPPPPDPAPSSVLPALHWAQKMGTPPHHGHVNRLLETHPLLANYILSQAVEQTEQVYV